jgi:acyl-CoA synthetase (NDP forming)
VPAALEECRKKGAAGAEIMSSGFRELGTSEGSDLEEEIKKIAARGIRVIGPNCFGIYCPESGLTFLPGPDLSRKKGNVAFISQSGGMSIDLANIGKWMGINFSKVISFGNGIDLRETELLNYLGQDPETHVISMYIEGIDDGESFYQTHRI